MEKWSRAWCTMPGLFSISKNVQTARVSTDEELQCRDHAPKNPFEILRSKLVHMSGFIFNWGLKLANNQKHVVQQIENQPPRTFSCTGEGRWKGQEEALSEARVWKTLREAPEQVSIGTMHMLACKCSERLQSGSKAIWREEDQTKATAKRLQSV